MARVTRPTFPLLLALCGAAACAPTAAPEGPQRPPGLYPEPARLAFTCVTPGCDETLTTMLTVTGGRRVAIKRILLTGDAAGDFSFTPSERPPFIVGSGAEFTVDVRYVPKGAPLPGTVELLITFTDASADESDDGRLQPDDLVIPLVRRLVGQPELTVKPTTLSFGVVRPGASKTLPLEVRNTGFGNVVLELSGVDAGSAEVQATLPDQRSLAADASVALPTTWSPTGEGYLDEVLTVEVATPGVAPAPVRVEGTSLTTPLLVFEPAAAVDFGEVAKGQSRRVQVQVVNRGGAQLAVQNVTSTDTTGNVRLYRADGGSLSLDGGTAFNIAPLGRVGLGLELKGIVPGEVRSQLVFETNETAVTRSLPVDGTVTEPRLTPIPATLDWGTLPIGWVVNKTVELRNTGWGTLTVKAITFVSGTSTLYTLVNKPSLPLALKRDQRVAFEVQLRAETQSTFAGFLSIETDDPVNPFIEVPLTATVGSCATSCPIAHGTPSCTTGTCQVGTCNTGWYDTDQSAATGCECQEVGTDPGEFCSSANNVGNLKDNDKTQRTFTGLIPVAGDVDLIRFHAEDAFALFDENFKVKVRLVSSDPGISVCIYRHPTGSAQPDCFFDNEVCPQTRYYEKGGSGGGSDDADFVVKVSRIASSAPTCTSYTVFMSNGL